mgnify:CR=1 FL=1
MCGIVGMLQGADAPPLSRSLLHAMNQSLEHRGPDDGGLHLEEGVGLGHRRLSIIDLGLGHQPLFNEDGSVAVVFNGEIYNFRALADELRAAGHQFRTHSDTEVLVHGWEQWGEALVPRLRGMFAFGLWDRARQCLFLARDRIGIKPLYYAPLADGGLIFASELKALLVHPGCPREVEPQAVEDYLAFGYVPDPRTILGGVHKLPPGHTLRIERGGEPRCRRYWQLQLAPEEPAPTPEALVEHLDEAVRSHLVADVPVGAFLSGGVDSSAVVALMAGAMDSPVQTTSIGFGDPQYNETDYAEQVARRYHTDHQTRQVDPDDFDLVERLAGIYDEPFADSSAMPTYRVCELARQRVKVVMSGDGGDELLGGYRRYRWYRREEQLRAALPLGLRRALFGALGAAYPKLDWAPRPLRARATFQALAMDSLEGYLDAVTVVGEGLRRSLYAAGFRRELQGYRAVEVLRRHAGDAPRDPLLRAQHLDFHTYLPGDILTKVDRASMAHGLEVRVPVLDHQLIEWAARVPASAKVHGGQGKYLLKRAVEPYLPRDLLYRPKMGFAVPLAGWFRGPLRERVTATLEGEWLLDSGVFEPDAVRRLLDEHLRGARDHSAPIWALLMLAGFQRNLAEGDHARGRDAAPAAAGA